MDDINHSRYEDDIDNVSVEDTDTHVKQEEVNKRPIREGAGTGVKRFEPTFEGESHDFIKNEVQLFTQRVNNEEMHKDAWDHHIAMKTATNVIFTQVQAKVGFKLFG